jgi:hypothetical protein
VTEVIFTNKNSSVPTATPTRTPNGTLTATPTRTPNTTPTPTSIPKGKLQICKEADGGGVTGDFKFRFETRSRIVPVGACSLIISVNAGTLTVTEDVRSGYVVTDIYTIPANRLISKDLNHRSATITISQGNAASQTIIVFVNRAVTSEAITDVVANIPRMDVRLSENPLDVFMQILGNSVRG